MKTIEQRINNIVGQLEGVKKMVGNNSQDCLSVVIQLKAVKSAVSSLMDKVITEELDHCLLKERNNKEKLELIFKEVIKK